MARVSVERGVRRFEFWWAPIPGTPQEAFFDDDTPGGIIWLSGGQGAGKTMSITAKALKLSAINAPQSGIWTVPDFKHVVDVIIPTLTDRDWRTGEAWFLEPDQYRYHQKYHVLEWDGGGTIHFESGENAAGIKGAKRAWGAIDEPGSIPFQAWRNTINRIRDPLARLRQIVMGGTPEGLGYLVDAFLEEERANYKLYTMDTRQNVELLEAVPEYVQQMLANVTEAERQAYLEGKPGRIIGVAAYPTFSRADHYTTDVPAPMEHVPLRITFDFNVEPMASVAGQIVPGHHGPELLVQDAVIQHSSWTVEVAQAWIKRYGRSARPQQGGWRGWPGGVIVYGDATGGNRTTTSKHSNYDLIREVFGPEFPKVEIHHSVRSKVNPAVSDRLNSVNVLLKNALGQVRMRIRKIDPAMLSPTRELVRSLEQTTLKPGTDDIWKKSGETVSHAADALGYLVYAEFPAKKPEIFGRRHFDNIDI